MSLLAKIEPYAWVINSSLSLAGSRDLLLHTAWQAKGSRSSAWAPASPSAMLDHAIWRRPGSSNALGQQHPARRSRAVAT